MSSFLYKKIWHGISIHTRKCIPGFASTEEGNVLTEEQQWKKIALVKEIATEVWG